MINPDRLAGQFTELVTIDSVSRQEGRLCRHLQRLLEPFAGQQDVDSAGTATGGDCGNLIARIAGDDSRSPILLSAHMDTVEPGRSIKPRFKNGVFSSAGDTILGADDKSAIAILLEVLHVLKEQSISHAPIELVLTVCEEVGLLGAKHLDYGKLDARMGYALDTRNPDAIVTRAPAANKISFTVMGREAHAGSSPEKGINAISIASKAVAKLPVGRLDDLTTCNLGLIQGGVATNVVPNRVLIEGEVRSHDPARLEEVTRQLENIFIETVDTYRSQGGDDLPRAEMTIEHDFDRLLIPDDHLLVKTARSAARNLGRDLEVTRSGGGSDANVFAAHGIQVAVLGTGMENVHSVRESIRLADMVKAAELVLEIVKNWGQKAR